MKRIIIVGLASLVAGLYIAYRFSPNAAVLSERAVDTSAGLLPTERVLTASERRQLSRILPTFTACSSKGGMEQVACVDGKLKEIASRYGARVGLDAASTYAKDHPIITSYSHDLSHTVGLYALAYEYKVDN